MSDDDTTVEDDPTPAEPQAPARQQRSLVLPALILAVGLVVGGFLMGSGGSDAPAEEHAAEEGEEVVPGEIVPLEPMTLNLVDGSYLRLGVAVELVEGVPGGEWVEHGESSKYVDAVIEKVGGWSSEQLTAEGGRGELKDVLRDAGTELFEHEFHEVYLTEYIVQ